MKYQMILEADTLQELGMKILDTASEVLDEEIWKLKDWRQKAEEDAFKWYKNLKAQARKYQIEHGIGFDLEKECKDPEFLHLLEMGVSVEDACFVLAQKKIEEKGKTKVMKLDEPPEIPDRKEKKAAVPRGYVKDPGIKEAPPLGSEKKNGKIDKDLLKVLLKQGWSKTKIAREMGVSQQAVYQIVKRCGLDEENI